MNKGFVECNGVAAPRDDLIDIFPQGVTILDGQVLIDAAGNAQAWMDTPAAGRRDHELPEFADRDRPFADLGKGFDDTDDVTAGDRGLEPQ